MMKYFCLFYIHIVNFGKKIRNIIRELPLKTHEVNQQLQKFICFFEESSSLQS